MAIILIIIEHFQFFGLFNYGDLSFLASLGSIGVDVFLFLSGFGLFKGYPKYNNIGSFYKKRIMRILPSYIGIMLIFDLLLMHPDNIVNPHVWFIHFFSNWFIPFILFMYVVFPIIYKIQKRWKFLPTMIAAITSFILSCTLIMLDHDNIHEVPMLMSQRLPIFTLGALFADERINFEIRKPYLYLVLIICMVVLYVVYWICGYEWIKYILFIPISCILLFLLCCENMRIGGGFLRNIGSLTLEIYLVSMLIMKVMSKYNFDPYVMVCVVCMTTYIGAILSQKLISFLLRYFK